MAPRVLILGGGPAGVAAAYGLTRAEAAEVELFERGGALGGNAGSFWSGRQWLDFGRHHLDPDGAPEALAALRAELGRDLVERPRQGRLRLQGRWLRYPPSAPDLLLHLDRRLALGAGADAFRSAVGRRRGAPDDSFAAAMEHRLGRALCEHLYFPYARKLWGLPPEALSAALAGPVLSAVGSSAGGAEGAGERGGLRSALGSLDRAAVRSALGSVGRLVQRAVQPAEEERFLYPREGFGQLTRALGAAAEAGGAQVHLRAEVTAVERRDDGWRVELTGPAPGSGAPPANAGEAPRWEAQGRHLWSTLPLPILVRAMRPRPPAEVVEAAARLAYRAVVLVYLELPVDRFHPADTHYFPERDIGMARLSEPKNFFGHAAPRGFTTLCAEIPCAPGDAVWTTSDAELGERVRADLARVELPLPAEPVRVFTRRRRFAHPVYARGFAAPLGTLRRWAATQPDLRGLGRQGAFVHARPHQVLAMGLAAAESLRAEGFDGPGWARRLAAAGLPDLGAGA